MIPLAHVGGIPLEEMLPAMTTGGAAGLLAVRGWIIVRIRRRRGTGR